jgi:signal recognition particle receptor subunit beta
VWSDYYVGADAIVFLVDSADRERFPEARRELDVCIAIALSLSLSRFDWTSNVACTHTTLLDTLLSQPPACVF